MNNPIRATRQSLGFTQEQFARKANIPLRTYKRYEADTDKSEYRIPNAVTAIKIAKNLGTTVEKLWAQSVRTGIIAD